ALLEAVVLLELGRSRRRLRRLAGQHALVGEGPPHERAHASVLRGGLGDDVPSAAQRRLDVGDPTLGRDEGGGLRLGLPVERLGEDQRGQWLEALLARDRGPRAALLLVRQIEIFELGLAVRGEDLPPQRFAQFALLLDRLEDGLTARLQL